MANLARSPLILAGLVCQIEDQAVLFWPVFLDMMHDLAISIALVLVFCLRRKALAMFLELKDVHARVPFLKK